MREEDALENRVNAVDGWEAGNRRVVRGSRVASSPLLAMHVELGESVANKADAFVRARTMCKV